MLGRRWMVWTCGATLACALLVVTGCGKGGDNPPEITSHPANQTVTEGQTATFSVTATGSPALTYQWKKNAVDIGGATASDHTTPATTLADDGAQFTCVVTNALGSVESNPATLTVDMAPVQITSHPSDQSVTESETATFSVRSEGNFAMGRSEPSPTAVKRSVRYSSFVRLRRNDKEPMVWRS